MTEVVPADHLPHNACPFDRRTDVPLEQVVGTHRFLALEPDRREDKNRREDKICLRYHPYTDLGTRNERIERDGETYRDVKVSAALTNGCRSQFSTSRLYGHLPAATVAALLDEDYERAAPKAKEPIGDLVAR
jgi:hypothetical protein